VIIVSTVFLRSVFLRGILFSAAAGKERGVLPDREPDHPDRSTEKNLTFLEIPASDPARRGFLVPPVIPVQGHSRRSSDLSRGSEKHTMKGRDAPAGMFRFTFLSPYRKAQEALRHRPIRMAQRRGCRQVGGEDRIVRKRLVVLAEQRRLKRGFRDWALSRRLRPSPGSRTGFPR